MDSQDKHIIPWSASDVQKYLRGELSAREMHQLEKDALDDPFLADAIDGLSVRTGGPLEDDLQQLQTRLADRVSEKKNRMILLPWMKVAASIALLAGLCFTAWFTLLDHPKAKLAQEPSHADSTKVFPPSSTTANAQPSVASSTPNPNATVPSGVASASRIASARKAKTSAFRNRPNSANRAPTGTAVYADDEKPTADSIEYLLKNKAASLDITPAYLNRLPNNLVFSGQVLGRDNHPLAGASLLVSGNSNYFATTNALGKFKLNLRPQDTSERLTVAMIGYKAASLPLNTLNSDNATSNTIFLRENPTALSEVIVSGTGKNRKEAFASVPSEDKNERLDSFWIKISPVSGRQAYLQYLETAKKTLQVDSTMQGTEVVSFSIDPKGIPIDFKIENSLSAAHDAGVIRLVTEGARWKAPRDKNVRAMVSVAFP